jgi:hypothetical protein
MGNRLVSVVTVGNPVPIHLEPLHVRAASLARGVPWALRLRPAWKLNLPWSLPKSSQVPCQQGVPSLIPADSSGQTINRQISATPFRASLPACKVHDAAALVVQVAMAVRPSPLAKGDLKHLN